MQVNTKLSCIPLIKLFKTWYGPTFKSAMQHAYACRHVRMAVYHGRLQQMSAKICMYIYSARVSFIPSCSVTRFVWTWIQLAVIWSLFGTTAYTMSSWSLHRDINSHSYPILPNTLCLSSVSLSLLFRRPRSEWQWRRQSWHCIVDDLSPTSSKSWSASL